MVHIQGMCWAAGLNWLFECIEFGHSHAVITYLCNFSYISVSQLWTRTSRS